MVEPTERVIADRYRLGPVIGRGGMATVHRAMDLRLERQVAVKLLRPEVSRDPDLAQRFRREALAATVLRHPNIVACLDTGTDGDQPYLVMDLVDGEDLAARLKRGGRLAPAQAARIGLDVARALGVAHVRGIVHRDIKPGNILLAADGRAMVTDFGIARLAADAEAGLPGTTLGSVHYFSPEQARGATTTPASDVYGLGLVLFEALTGERALSGDTTDAIALARVGAAAPSPGRSARRSRPSSMRSCAGPSPRSPATDIRTATRWRPRSRPLVTAGDVESDEVVARARGRRHRRSAPADVAPARPWRRRRRPSPRGPSAGPAALQPPSRVVRGTRRPGPRRGGPPDGRHRGPRPGPGRRRPRRSAAGAGRAARRSVTAPGRDPDGRPAHEVAEADPRADARPDPEPDVDGRTHRRARADAGRHAATRR